MKSVFIILSYLITFGINAQNDFCSNTNNLLLNSDFEDCLIARNGNFINYKLVNWFSTPNNIVTDIIDKYDSSYMLDIDKPYPFCIDCNLSGGYCIGFMPLSWSGYFETIIGELNEPLVKGNSYRVKINIKFSENNALFKLRELDVVFSSNKYIYGHESFRTYESVLLSNGNMVRADLRIKLNDVNKWQSVESVYKANGGEQYVTFGIFYNKKFSKDIFRFKRLIKTSSDSMMKSFFIKNDDLIFPANIDNLRDDSLLFGSFYYIDCISIVEIVD